MCENIDISKAIKKMRRKNGSSQGEVCRKTGFERSYISDIERKVIKNPSLPNIQKLAKAFGLTIDEFIKIAMDKNDKK